MRLRVAYAFNKMEISAGLEHIAGNLFTQCFDGGKLDLVA